MTRFPHLLFAVTLVTAGACGDSSRPTAPTPPPALGERTGTWVGTLTDRLNGTGSIRLLLEDRPVGSGHSFVGGTWSASFPQAARNDAGTFGGAISGSVVSLLLTPTTPPVCGPGFLSSLAGSFSLTLHAGSTSMAGSSSYITCNESADGRVELTKQ